MKRVTIYARVSTREQNPELQLADLRNYVIARGLTLVAEYVDYASGSKSERTNYQKLLDDARKRRTDIVLVWKFDRFARSTKELINALEEFKALGVDFISYKENIDTSTPAGKILFTMISAFAEFEREIIRERVRAGMDRAKAKGKSIGRPKIPQYKINMALDLTAKGIDYKTIIRKLEISKSAYFQIKNKKY